MKILKTIAMAAVVVIVMNVLHEAGHALTAKALGYEVVAKINSVGLRSGDYATAWHRHAVDLAGPAVTLLLAFVGAGWANRRRPRAQLGAMMVSSALMMRILATLASINHPNDEPRVSEAWGLGYWTLSGIVIALLAWLMVMVHRKARLGWKFYLPVWVGASIGFGVVVLGEPHLPALRF